jgi:hypothetical protein
MASLTKTSESASEICRDCLRVESTELTGHHHYKAKSTLKASNSLGPLLNRLVLTSPEHPDA